MRDLTYGTAFAMIAAANVWLASQGSWATLLAWPGISFALVSVAYFTGDVRWFGKRSDGCRHWLATLCLWPYLLFASFAWTVQTAWSSEDATNAVNAVLVVARRLRPSEIPAGIVHVCDLTSEFTDPPVLRNCLRYRALPILDAGIMSAASLVSSAREMLPPNEGQLLIHCANGHGRTGMVAAVWLMVHGCTDSPDDAIRMLQAVRPGIALRERQRNVVYQAADLIKCSKKVVDA